MSQRKSQQWEEFLEETTKAGEIIEKRGLKQKNTRMATNLHCLDPTDDC
jgi:hypothetical protein